MKALNYLVAVGALASAMLVNPSSKAGIEVQGRTVLDFEQTCNGPIYVDGGYAVIKNMGEYLVYQGHLKGGAIDSISVVPTIVIPLGNGTEEIGLRDEIGRYTPSQLEKIDPNAMPRLVEKLRELYKRCNLS